MYGFLHDPLMSPEKYSEQQGETEVYLMETVVYLHISHSHLVIVTYSLTLTGFSQCSTCCVFILDSDY